MQLPILWHGSLHVIEKLIETKPLFIRSTSPFLKHCKLCLSVCPRSLQLLSNGRVLFTRTVRRSDQHLSLGRPFKVDWSVMYDRLIYSKIELSILITKILLFWLYWRCCPIKLIESATMKVKPLERVPIRLNRATFTLYRKLIFSIQSNISFALNFA